MSKQLTVKVANNRGATRLWFESMRLAKAGFVKGASYTVDYANDKTVIRLAKDGNRDVSGRTKNGKDIPIIELTSKQLNDLAGNNARLDYTITDGQIIITAPE